MKLIAVLCYSELYRSSSFNSSGRSSNCDTADDMYSDVSLEEDVLDLNHKVGHTFYYIQLSKRLLSTHIYSVGCWKKNYKSVQDHSTSYQKLRRFFGHSILYWNQVYKLHIHMQIVFLLHNLFKIRACAKQAICIRNAKRFYEAPSFPNFLRARVELPAILLRPLPN